MAIFRGCLVNIGRGYMSGFQKYDILSMIMGSGPMVQFVLLTLLFFSILCWTIILVKYLRFKRARRKNAAFLEIFKKCETLNQLQLYAEKSPSSPMAQVFFVVYEEVCRLQEETKEKNITHTIWIENIDRSIKKGVQAELSSLERRVPLLATIGNSAPFIGLFGTVWGIMRSFHSIGLHGSASLATVAPGISEALIATAAGLAAAIPSVIAFNAFTGSLSRLETELYGFAGDFINLVERKLASPRTMKGEK
jgi:biopolymer transport protein TolQ